MRAVTLPGRKGSRCEAGAAPQLSPGTKPAKALAARGGEGRGVGRSGSQETWSGPDGTGPWRIEALREPCPGEDEMTRVIGVLTFAFVLCSSGQAAAQDPATPMDPVVVTATKTATPVGQTGSSLSGLTREQVEQRQAMDVLQMLREQPGFSLIQSGTRGSPTHILTPGGNNDMKLLLIHRMEG